MEYPEETPPSAESLEVSPALARALRQVLRPLVRLLLAKGVTYPYLARMLKGVYVDVAIHDFPLEGKRQTDSRLSLLTGVHRKDVRRLAAEPAERREAPPPHVSLSARLLARWSGESDYLDEQGRPRPLPRLPQADGGASFERLVADESKDIRARAVLDEWLRLGLAEIDAEDRVILRASACIPEKGQEERLFFLGRNLSEHLAAAAHNVLGEQPPFLERSVHSAGLDAAAVEELQRMAETQGMELLHALNRRARELRAVRNPETPEQRMSLGVYFHAKAVPPENEDALPPR